MPKVTLTKEFNLPEEREEYEIASRSESYYYVISDIIRHLRNRLKYHELSEEQEKAFKEVQETLFDSISQHCNDDNF